MVTCKCDPIGTRSHPQEWCGKLDCPKARFAVKPDELEERFRSSRMSEIFLSIAIFALGVSVFFLILLIVLLLKKGY